MKINNQLVIKCRVLAGGLIPFAPAVIAGLFTLAALALVLVIEGLFLALFPHRLRQVLAMMEQMPPEALRLGGLVAVSAGVLLVWILRG